MGKTQEDSERELAQKTPYTVGVVHDTILRFKKPLLVLLVKLFDRIPTPTAETCKHPNARRLVEIRDEFMKRNQSDGARHKAMSGIINFVIMMYEYDAPYRQRIDWVLRKVQETPDWWDNTAVRPAREWKDEDLE